MEPRALIAIVGSSGGSTLRGDARSEHAALSLQLEGSGFRLGWMVYVEGAEPLDHASGTLPVTLFQLRGANLVATSSRPLSAISTAVAAADAELAGHIARGSVAALVLTSADVSGVNRASVSAAVRHGVPILGTGGTGLGVATQMGALMLQLSGSVSTNAEGRAMAMAAALARHFGLPFRPVLPACDLHVLPVLDAALPIVVCLAVVLRALTLFPNLLVLAGLATGGSAATSSSAAVAVSGSLVPLVLAAVGGGRAAGLGESGTIAGIFAGCLTVAARTASYATGIDGAGTGASTGPVAAAALASGYVAGLCARHVLTMSHGRGLPATASSHLVSGGAGFLGGLAGLLLAAPLGWFCLALRALLVWPASLPTPVAAAAGGLAGVATLAGSVHGYYHAVMLPLIILEMCEGELSLLGALDAACLCATCAGVMTAVEMQAGAHPQTAARFQAVMGRQRTGWSAAAINTLFGDYVEACYPHMEKRHLVCFGAYAGAAAAGALIVASGPARSSAYLPLPLAVGFAEAPHAMLGACVLAFLLPWAATAATLAFDARALSSRASRAPPTTTQTEREITAGPTRVRSTSIAATSRRVRRATSRSPVRA